MDKYGLAEITHAEGELMTIREVMALTKSPTTENYLRDYLSSLSYTHDIIIFRFSLSLHVGRNEVNSAGKSTLDTRYVLNDGTPANVRMPAENMAI